ncbi:MAG TPA: serine/threonine-protein kinase, partial [Caulobacteraceae bacterium]|nr:serine/threonine-protein kinase [Caulobacteraceae bacterium]
VLNNIYEVKRLIGRGGMGEVFEGVNVNDDHDKVAIKVMLPSLAADPNVQAMFRKEARTLTRLSHPAVVQYRVLAQEPRLGVFYIVTEFIDGEPLSDMLARLKPSSEELRGLIRRLAEGLKAAHDLGAVHRDMSPDNVLLPAGRLDRAKIIDFGIAKDLDPSKATIVGDGFAGKLGYVAPEQFGDFGRQIGPWTDVYSLGLVILSLASGRNVDMGATLVEAVDKRRAGPDLTVIPADLRPVLAAMTAADPAKRLRSMDEVLAMLGGAMAPSASAPPAPAPIRPARVKPAKGAATAGGGVKALPVILGGLAVAVVAAAIAFMLLGKKPSTPSAPPAAPAAATAGGAPAAETARKAIQAALANIPCSWLDVVSATRSGAGVAVKLTGVAGATQAVDGAVLQAAHGAGVSVPDVNLVDVLPVAAPICPPLDALRPFRADTSVGGPRLSTSQARYTLEKQPDGTLSQKAVITMAIRDPTLDFALFGIDPAGTVSEITNRGQFETELKNPASQDVVSSLGGDTYRLSITTTPPTGLEGLLLLTGKGPFDPKLIAAAARGPDWSAKVATAARAGGWQAEMVWYKTVDAGG